MALPVIAAVPGAPVALHAGGVDIEHPGRQRALDLVAQRHADGAHCRECGRFSRRVHEHSIRLAVRTHPAILVRARRNARENRTDRADVTAPRSGCGWAHAARTRTSPKAPAVPRVTPVK